MAKVLILDDDVILGRFLQIGLRRSGHDVRVAGNRDRAYAIAPDFRPDVLVVDWRLSETVDGIQVAQVVRAGLPQLRVILITGYSSETLEREAAVAKIPTVLAKPFELTELTEAIQELTTG